jgi:DNA-binding transcriptional regulator YiaG
MNSPITGKEMILAKERRTLSFRKEEFEVIYHSYKCVDSGESFTTEQLDELNLNQLYNQYRVKFTLPFPDKIKSIREKYDISVSKMSEVLGFGANSYRNYEAGEVPSQSNARLIQLVDDAHEFKKLITLSNAYEGQSKEKILRKVETIILEQNQYKQKLEIENYLIGKNVVDSNTGYRQPDLAKFAEMVVFFTERLQPWKTKLNKLLFYADFNMFRNTIYSISGIQYQAISMGPVPYNFQSIFEYLANNDDVDVYFTTFPEGNVGEQFKPNKNRKFNPGLFNELELKTLEEVAERFKKTSTTEIIEISHREKAWIENVEAKKIIDYRYSFDLN